MADEQVQHCCENLREQVNYHCDQHPQPGSCSGHLVRYAPEFDEYGLWIHDGENGSAGSSLAIAYCPFCGTSLPGSRRNEWFDLLESRGLEPEDAPETMLGYGWWLRE